MRSTLAFFALILAIGSASLRAGAAAQTFEGTVGVTETRGGAATHFLYTRRTEQLRIENVDKSRPNPINILDLAAKKLTIVYPHNSSFVQVDLTNAEPQAGAPTLPPGFPAQPSLPRGNASVSPAISPPPGFPTPPPMPSMPNNPMAGGAAAMPMMPPMPAMGSFAQKMELKKTDQTKKIQGYDCTLYTISDRMEKMEIWATSDASLFPFRLLQTNYHTRHFGPQMLEEQWAGLLQLQSLFPLEAVSRMGDNGPERFSFKVDKIEQKKIENADELFKPPQNYLEINH